MQHVDGLARARWRQGGRAVVAVFALLGAALALMPVADAKGNPGKIDICHQEGDSGEYHLISVSTKAEQQHRDNHGDGMVGEAVPGVDGHVFDEDCVPVPIARVLIRAFGDDAEGNEVTFSEWLDTNGDGIPSAGDTVRSPLAPASFDGSSISPTGLAECVLDSGGWSDISRGFSRADGSGVTASGASCRVAMLWDTDADSSTTAACDVRLHCVPHYDSFSHSERDSSSSRTAAATDTEMWFRARVLRCTERWDLFGPSGPTSGYSNSMCGDQPWLDTKASFTP